MSTNYFNQNYLNLLVTLNLSTLFALIVTIYLLSR